jgi:glucosamine--fructose-6-phosphate aminotransferase (isomerizing)
MSVNHFLSEIHEQPAALQNTLDFYREGDGGDQLSRAIRDWKDRRFDRIIFTGMGSSFFISNTASAILNNHGIQAVSINTGELIHYYFPVITPRTLIVCISQSGESYEIVKLLEKMAGGNYCIGISNEPESTLARQCHLLLLSKAGKEYMTSTKTFTSTALVAVMLSLAIADKWNTKSVSVTRSMIETVGNLIHNHSGWIQGSVNMLEKTDFVQLLGRGPSMAAVLQGALMFMEGTRRPASALFSGEFRHGPMELINEKILVILLAPEGETYLQHVKLAEDIHRFGGNVIFLSNRDPISLSKEILHIPVPCTDEFFFSIPASIPLQLMVNEWAVYKG